MEILISCFHLRIKTVLLDNVAVQEYYLTIGRNSDGVIGPNVYTEDTSVSEPGNYVTEIPNYVFFSFVTLISHPHNREFLWCKFV